MFRAISNLGIKVEDAFEFPINIINNADDIEDHEVENLVATHKKLGIEDNLKGSAPGNNSSWHISCLSSFLLWYPLSSQKPYGVAI